MPSLPRPEPAPLSTRFEVLGDRRGGSIVVRQQTISHAGERVASVRGAGAGRSRRRRGGERIAREDCCLPPCMDRERDALS